MIFLITDLVISGIVSLGIETLQSDSTVFINLNVSITSSYSSNASTGILCLTLFKLDNIVDMPNSLTMYVPVLV